MPGVAYYSDLHSVKFVAKVLKIADLNQWISGQADKGKLTMDN